MSPQQSEPWAEALCWLATGGRWGGDFFWLIRGVSQFRAGGGGVLYPMRCCKESVSRSVCTVLQAGVKSVQIPGSAWTPVRRLTALPLLSWGVGVGGTVGAVMDTRILFKHSANPESSCNACTRCWLEALCTHWVNRSPKQSCAR